MDKNEIFESLICPIRAILDNKEDSNKKLERVCELLRSNIPGYDWVGFYLVDQNADEELVIGPYAGDPTDHTRIAFGDGICGRAASELETIVVGDVCKESNYLSCSAFVKSEIVVPIIKNGNLLGEIDVDSHELDNFNDEDSAFLELVCEITSDLVESIERVKQ